MLGSTAPGEGGNYGLGVKIHSGKFGKAVGHDGEYPGFLSNMRYFPQYKIAVAAQVNDDGTPAANKFGDAAIDDFAQIIVEELVGDKLSGAEKLQFQKMAEAWLKLVDAGKYVESWDEVSAELKAKYARDKWQTALAPLAKEAGRLKSRKFKSVMYSEEKTVAVDFESSFSKIPEAIETVILTLEKDGQWRVTTYSIK